MSATVFYESASEAATVTLTYGSAPSAVSWAVTAPDGTTTTYTYAAGQITQTSSTVYTKNIACTLAGEWVLVSTTTAPADVQEVRWTVFGTVDKLYCSLESLKSRLGLTDTNDDFELLGAIRAASEQIDGYTGRERVGFGRDAAVTTRTFEASDSRSVFIPEGISTASGVIVKTDEDGDGTYERTLTVSTDFLLRPSNALTDGWPYTEVWLADNYSFPVLSNGRDGVQITARFGWPSVPWSVREACLILSQRLFKRKETSTGVIGFDGLGATVRLARTDPDVAELLSRYRVYAVA